jgi:hypothetical protein
MTEPTASRRRLIFGALLLVLFIASLDQMIVSRRCLSRVALDRARIMRGRI